MGKEGNIKNDLGCTRTYNTRTVFQLFTWNSWYIETFHVAFFMIKIFSDILNFQLRIKLAEICKWLS